MSDHADTPQADRNYEAFRTRLPELLPAHAGKIALMRDGEIIDFFDTYADAIRFGMEKYKSQDQFSVQQVTENTISLGIYSHAGVLH